MSIVKIADGVAVGTQSRTLMIAGGKTVTEALADPKAYATPLGGTDQHQGDFAMWGTNNLLPQEMAADIEATTVLQAGIEAKARIAIGKGPMLAKVVAVNKDGGEELEFVDDPEIADWLEFSNAFDYSLNTSRDLFGFANAWTQLVFSRDLSRLLAFRRHDPCECRLSIRSEATGRSEKLYLSGDWGQFSSTDKTKNTASLPLLDEHFPLLDLQSRKPGGRSTFAIHLHYALTGRQYYAVSPWYSARRWVKIAQNIPLLKAAMFDNQATIKYVVRIHDKYWELSDPKWSSYDPDTKKAKQDEFYAALDAKLVGQANAFKMITSPTFTDPEGKPVKALEIEVLDDKVKDGKLLPDGTAAASEILFSLLINPALVGLQMPGGSINMGAGSGSNIRESFLVQVMLLEAERRLNSKVFNLAKQLHGWDRRYVLRFPNQILTTLNTGANTQSTA